MPILNRITKPSIEIKDYRNTRGVYYEAFCDQCGLKYYPKRSTAKFCSKFCSNESSRGNSNINKERNLIEAGYYDIVKKNRPKGKPESETINKKQNVETLIGALNVYKHISNYVDTNRKKGGILRDLKDLEIGENYSYLIDKKNCITVKKISTLSYKVFFERPSK